MNIKNIYNIGSREFKAYFISPIAYVYLITFLVIINWFFFRTFFLVGQANIRSLFSLMPWIFLFFVPAVSMGKWSEERKAGTLELLFTMPVRDTEVILAKFFAGLLLIVCALLLTLPILFTVMLLGDVDLGPAIGGYLGLIFLGGAYLSIGLTVSSLTENQIIAFILGVALCFIMLMIGTPLVLSGKSNLITHVIQYAGLGTHFESIARGVVDSRDIVYYLSVIAFFLFLNAKILKTKARL